MNFENLNNIVSPIEAENNEEREEKLNQKIAEISLIYAVNKFEKGNDNTESFSEVVKNHTPLENFIKKPLYQLDDFKTDEYQDKIENYFKDFYSEIDKLDLKSPEVLEKASNLIEEKRKNIVKFLEVENLPISKKGPRNFETELIIYNEVSANHGLGRYQELVEKNFSKLDSFLEIHFDSLFTKENESVSPEKLRKDLSIIASQIVLKNPEIAAVIGQSWLLDTSIAKNLGFKKEDSIAVMENDLSTWLQFIDKDGQINKGRFEQLINTGELPFKSVQAYIKTEDFLKKYLPSELRGKIVLKEIDETEAKKQEELLSDNDKLKHSWEEAISNNDFNSFIKSETFNNFTDYLEKSDQDVFIDFLKLMFANGIKDFSKMRTPEIEIISQNFKEAKKKRLYRDKELIIN